jgi:N-acetylmuramoyl-L-alanine amidase
MDVRWSIPMLAFVSLPAVADPVRIVIDPGHGGSNLGAAGATGMLEKELTLGLARHVREEILRLLPDADVRLTREDDRLVTLSQRAEIANACGATALVSLHFNASPDRSQRGFETYVHGPGAPVEPGETDRGAGVGDILADLRREATGAESAHLAALVQRHMADAFGPMNDRGVKRAPFDVLYESRVPSVLVEVGFIDHADEGVTFVRPDAQRAAARAVARAIVEFARREARRVIFAASP